MHDLGISEASAHKNPSFLRFDSLFDLWPKLISSEEKKKILLGSSGCFNWFRNCFARSNRCSCVLVGMNCSFLNTYELYWMSPCNTLDCALGYLESLATVLRKVLLFGSIVYVPAIRIMVSWYCTDAVNAFSTSLQATHIRRKHWNSSQLCELMDWRLSKNVHSQHRCDLRVSQQLQMVISTR